MKENFKNKRKVISIVLILLAVVTICGIYYFMNAKFYYTGIISDIVKEEYGNANFNISLNATPKSFIYDTALIDIFNNNYDGLKLDVYVNDKKITNLNRVLFANDKLKMVTNMGKYKDVLNNKYNINYSLGICEPITDNTLENKITSDRYKFEILFDKSLIEKSDTLEKVAVLNLNLNNIGIKQIYSGNKPWCIMYVFNFLKNEQYIKSIPIQIFDRKIWDKYELKQNLNDNILKINDDYVIVYVESAETVSFKDMKNLYFKSIEN